MVDVTVTDHHPKRGELRIYLGAAPGVGKTYAMLGEAHRRLERGTDLVAAVVETHGRRKTAELLEGIEIIPPPLPRIPRRQLSRTRRAGRAGTASAGGAGRRTRPHQYAGQQEPKALAGRRGAARRRHHGDLHGQHPAPGKPQRRRRPDHRHRTEGDDAGFDRARGCAGRAHRHHAGGAAPQAIPRQRLRFGTNRCGAVQLLPPRKPHRTKGIGAAVAGRPGGYGAGQVPRGQQDHRHVGGARASRGGGHRWPGIGDVGTAGIPDRVEVQRRADGGTRHTRRRAGRPLGAPDEQDSRAGEQPGRFRAHRGRRRHTRCATGFRPRDQRHPAGDRQLTTVSLGAGLRGGHRPGDRAAVRQDRRAHRHP